MHVLIVYSHTKRGDAVLNVLRDMTESFYEPSVVFCNALLDGALFIGDTKVLRVLSTWYLNNFPHRLDHGIITRMLHVASAAGNIHSYTLIHSCPRPSHTLSLIHTL